MVSCKKSLFFKLIYIYYVVQLSVKIHGTFISIELILFNKETFAIFSKYICWLSSNYRGFHKWTVRWCFTRFTLKSFNWVCGNKNLTILSLTCFTFLTVMQKQFLNNIIVPISFCGPPWIRKGYWNNNQLLFFLKYHFF